MTTACGKRTRGELREDGKLFWQYKFGHPNKEYWVSPEQFATARKRAEVASLRQEERRQESGQKTVERKLAYTRRCPGTVELHREKARLRYLKYSAENPERARQRSSEWRKKNPERCLNGALRKQHGISLAEYRCMLVAQGSRCAICGTHRDELPRRLYVDHCHSSGEIRGAVVL